MKHEKIDSKARVWNVVRSPDGKLQEQLDAEFLAALTADRPENEIAAECTREIAKTRVW